MTAAPSLDRPDQDHLVGASSSVGPGSGRTAIVVGVIVALVLMLGVPVRSWFVQRADLAAARAQLAQADSRLVELREQVKQWEDPQHVEEQARLRLNYVYPGEVSVIVLQPQTGDSGSPDVPADWFAGLWSSVEAAAGRNDSAASSRPVQVRPEAPR